MRQTPVATGATVLLTVDQLAKCLHKSVASIRSDATRNPQSLPPICRLPGTKRLLWRPEDVERWLAVHVDGALPPQPSTTDDTYRPRRGRPTKAEQLARQRRAPPSSRPESDHATLG